MESRPKNPEFRNNPENFHPCSYSRYYCLFGLMLYIPVNNFSVISGHFPELISTKQRIESYSRTQCSASGESRTSNPSISSLPLSHHASLICWLVLFVC